MDKNSLEYKLYFKYRSGQINKEEYDELLSKFEKLGMLSKKPTMHRRKIHVEGSKSIDEIIIEGPVTISGGVTVNGDVECINLSTSGSVNIIGHLLVKDKASLSGEVNVSDDVKFIGKTNITGSLKVGDNIICTDRISITGSLIANDVTLGDKLTVLGKLNGDEIKSSSEIIITGSIKSSSVLAERFLFTSQLSKNNKSIIDGDIHADVIKITSPMKLINLKLNKLQNLKIPPSLSNILPLESILETTINQLIPDMVDSLGSLADEFSLGISSITDMMSAGFTVTGDLVGNKIYLSHINIMGDVIGKIIKIGSKVKISGKIIYSQSLDVPRDTKYFVEKE